MQVELAIIVLNLSVVCALLEGTRQWHVTAILVLHQLQFVLN